MAKYNLMDGAKNTVKLGILSGAGMGIVGAIPGAGNTPIPGIMGAGLGLANMGQLAQTGMGVASTLSPRKDKKSKNCHVNSQKHLHGQADKVLSKFF